MPSNGVSATVGKIKRMKNKDKIFDLPTVPTVPTLSADGSILVSVVSAIPLGSRHADSSLATRQISLEDKLKKIHCLQELYGFANRRKVLGIADENVLPKWDEDERRLILARKYELEKKK